MEPKQSMDRLTSLRGSRALCTGLWLLLLCDSSLLALDLDAYSEYLRPGPTGTPVSADCSASESRSGFSTKNKRIQLPAARNGYVSFFVVVKHGGEIDYSLSLGLDRKSTGIQPQLFKTWYHRLRSRGLLIPDALVPVENPFHSKLPDPDNHISGQNAQGFWVDLWIPR